MKPKVDGEICIGCALCVDTCPDVFEMGDDGVARVIREEPGPEHYECVRDAAELCPVDAITIGA